MAVAWGHNKPLERDKRHGLLTGPYLSHSDFHRVDGRKPAPVDMVNIPLFTRFYTSQVVSRISEPSTVSIQQKS